MGAADSELAMLSTRAGCSLNVGCAKGLSIATLKLEGEVVILAAALAVTAALESRRHRNCTGDASFASMFGQGGILQARERGEEIRRVFGWWFYHEGFVGGGCGGVWCGVEIGANEWVLVLVTVTVWRREA